MYSDACKNFKCQEPLTLKANNTGEERELLCWDWPTGAAEQVATFTDGDRWAASQLALLWTVQPCKHCGDAHPATNWPSDFGPGAHALLNPEASRMPRQEQSPLR